MSDMIPLEAPPRRPTWREYHLAKAKLVATRATCPRRSVGCVIVTPENRPLTEGYNGSLPGELHCKDIGCLMVDGHCKRTVHAELNALANAAKHGIAINGAIAYVTLEPCSTCRQALHAAGVKNIIYEEPYE